MTTNRRQLLGQVAGAVSGIAFTTCGLGHLASAQVLSSPHRRREVVVSGKRVRTIDVHAHCHIPEATALMGTRKTRPHSSSLTTGSR
jgi:aminocarboxymuconate-semialdehyde decarboxylase